MKIIIIGTLAFVAGVILGAIVTAVIAMEGRDKW